MALITLGFEDAPVPPTDGNDRLTQALDLELEGLGDRVVTALRSKQQLSAEEAEQLNEILRAEVRTTLDTLGDKISSAFEFLPGEDPQQAEVKLRALQLYMGFIARLSAWLLNKLHALVSQINAFYQLCWQKAQELFQFLRSILKKIE